MCLLRKCQYQQAEGVQVQSPILIHHKVPCFHIHPLRCLGEMHSIVGIEKSASENWRCRGVHRVECSWQHNARDVVRYQFKALRGDMTYMISPTSICKTQVSAHLLMSLSFWTTCMIVCDAAGAPSFSFTKPQNLDPARASTSVRQPWLSWWTGEKVPGWWSRPQDWFVNALVRILSGSLDRVAWPHVILVPSSRFLLTISSG